MNHDETDRRPTVPSVALGDVLGAGAFGTVYRGRHTSLDIDVAVKLIDVAKAGVQSHSALLQEAQLMARLDHPNLLRVFDAGMVEQHIYLVFEFMDGGSCAGLRAVAPKTATNMALQLLSGLQSLHEARILHRDIKPANCLKRQDDRVKLADLGLAIEVTPGTERTMEWGGTIPFMAPELFDHPPRYGPASDLYALGMTMACFVLDTVPYPRGSQAEVLPWIRQGPRPSIVARRPDLPTPLSSLVDRMISPQADARPRTVAQALSELTAVMPAQSADEGLSTLGGPIVGPWIIGAAVYSSSNWEGWVVTHNRTGAAGRLMRLKPDGPLRDAASMVLAAAERAASLDDRFVVPVLDWGLWDDRVFVVTAPWGHTINDLVRARGPFDEVSALHFARDLAEAMVSIHGRGLVYQNLDPGSAVVGFDARSAQLSWPIYCVPAGIDGDERILVPRYAAPEALDGSSPTIEPAVDVYGLGVLLLFMVTGAAPPRTDQPVNQLVRAKAPQVTAATAAFIGDLLAVNSARRPTSEAALGRMRELLARLGG